MIKVNDFKKLEIAVVIPARGGSKRLKDKNIYPVLGKPMINWVLEEVLASKHINSVYVTSESEKILNTTLKDKKIICIKRPKQLSSDDVEKMDAIAQAVEHIISDCNLKNPDIVINFGSCGNLKQYEKGTVLEVNKTVNDFEAFGIEDNTVSIPNTGFLTVKDQVTCFTTDTFFDAAITDYTLPYLDNIRNCDIVDMESYSIVESCLHANKIVYCYKWVSDDGDSSSWEENAALGFNKFKQLLHERLS